MKFGTVVDVPEVVTWAEFYLENLMGLNFTGGQILCFSIDFAYMALTQCSATALPVTHTRTVVRECCKGDDASQWRNPKFADR